MNKEDGEATSGTRGTSGSKDKKKKSTNRESEMTNKGGGGAKDQAKKKKKKMTLLDGFNKTNVEDNVVASFDIDLSGLVDGHTREVVRKLSAKLPPVVELDIKPVASAGKKKKDISKKVNSASKKKPTN